MNSAEYQGDIAPDGTFRPFPVAVRDGVNDAAVSFLQRTPHLEVVGADDPAAQGMLIRSATKFERPEHFDRFPSLAYLARVGVGVDNVDMTHASEARVATVNTPGASTAAVAQRVIALIHAWSARIIQGTQALRNHEWPKGRKDLEPIDLSRKTLGIVGYGRIGQEVHRRAEELFQHVLYADVRDDVEGRTDLATLLHKADVISLHVAGNGEILDAAAMEAVKPGALIVNTARGGVMDHEALLRKMDQGVHAALDVFPLEKPAMFDDSTLRKIVDHPQFLGTPHTAASDAVTQEKLAQEAATRMREFAREGTINPLDIPGHTLPRVALSERPVPGVRGVLLHKSVPGVLQAVTDPISRHGVNIHSLANGEGNGGLAATIVHFQEQDPRAALAIAHDIGAHVGRCRMRLLRFA